MEFNCNVGNTKLVRICAVAFDNRLILPARQQPSPTFYSSSRVCNCEQHTEKDPHVLKRVDMEMEGDQSKGWYPKSMEAWYLKH